jgi:hypothetical protein
MKYNYYCNGQGFDKYEDALFYAEVLLAQFRVYKAIYTKTEVQSMLEEVAHG